MTIVNPNGPEKVTYGHEDIPDIPEGVELPSSEGSLIEDVEPPVEVDYTDVNLEEDN